MAHLIKLELRKIHLRNYVGIVLVSILSGMLFVAVALHDSSDRMHTFEQAFRVMEMIFAFVFIIFFSVLIARIVLSEYNDKTILILFTYPVNRKKMIAAKLILITFFVAVSTLAGYLVCGTFVAVMDARYDWVADVFRISMLYDWVSRAISTTVMFCILGLWTFIVGMWRKSVPVTIVSSVIFIYLRQVVIASTENYRENIWILLAAGAIALAGMWYVFQRKITQLD